MCEKESKTTTTVTPPRALSFSFTGYTIWFDVQEVEGDWTNVHRKLQESMGLSLIPGSHITCIYGRTFPSPTTALTSFKNLQSFLLSQPSLSPYRAVPPFKPTAVLCDKEVRGVDGGLMDMVWAEVSVKKERAHTEIVEIAERMFGDFEEGKDGFIGCGDGVGSGACERAEAWRPHLSLAYDNVEDPVLNLGRVLEVVGEVGGTIVEERRVKGMSLWDMNGRMEDWECIDRFEF